MDDRKSVGSWVVGCWKDVDDDGWGETFAVGHPVGQCAPVPGWVPHKGEWKRGRMKVEEVQLRDSR